MLPVTVFLLLSALFYAACIASMLDGTLNALTLNSDVAAMIFEKDYGSTRSLSFLSFYQQYPEETVRCVGLLSASGSITIYPNSPSSAFFKARPFGLILDGRQVIRGDYKTCLSHMSHLVSSITVRNLDVFNEDFIGSLINPDTIESLSIGIIHGASGNTLLYRLASMSLTNLKIFSWTGGGFVSSLFNLATKLTKIIDSSLVLSELTVDHNGVFGGEVGLLTSFMNSVKKHSARLKVLKLTLTRYDWSSLDAVFSHRFPNLLQFHLIIHNHRYNVKARQLDNLTEFLSFHSNNLCSLILPNEFLTFKTMVSHVLSVKLPRLKHLSLSNLDLNSSSDEVKIFDGYMSVESLDLSINYLDRYSFRFMLALVEKFPNLQTLDLSRNNLNSLNQKEWEVVIDELCKSRRYSSLKVLLHGNLLSVSDILFLQKKRQCIDFADSFIYLFDEDDFEQ